MQTKIIDLKSIAKYKHTQSIIEAISDEDFKTRYSHIIVQTLRINDATNRKKAFDILQARMSEKDLRTIENALDYYGFMYDFMGKSRLNLSAQENLKDQKPKNRKENIKLPKKKEKKWKEDKRKEIEWEEEEEKRIYAPIPVPMPTRGR